jgi:hypothetical protein
MTRRLAVAACALALAACADLSFTPAIDRIPAPIANPSFARDIAPLLAATCASSGACHGGVAPQKDMNLSAATAYAAMVNVAGQFAPAEAPWRVRPGAPESSLVFRLIDTAVARPGGYPYRMPLTSTPLPSAVIETIRNWIEQGALNN